MRLAGIGSCRADGAIAKRERRYCEPADGAVRSMPVITGNDDIDELHAASHGRRLREWLAARTRSHRPHRGTG